MMNGLRVILYEPTLIGFELPYPNEKMSLAKEELKQKKVVIQFYDEKIKVYSRHEHFALILRTLWELCSSPSHK